MDAEQFLKRLKRADFFRDQMVHIRSLPPQEAALSDLKEGLHPAVKEAFSSKGVHHLYGHQVEAIQWVRQGQHVVVVTGTASGKTLCYTIPILEQLLKDRHSTTLLLFPTKALAQDQLRGLVGLQEEGDSFSFLAGTYDGDTPQNLRRQLRNQGNLVLTNPDMLHQGILPHHARWNRFFSHLKYVVVDEIHAYRGVFGSHLANVRRRLDRICSHYGSSPQFICCSATIGNPKEHAERITGREMRLVDRDDSPKGPKRFVLWNPPPLEQAARGNSMDWRVGGDRRSPLWEAVYLMSSLVKEGIQTIAFVRTRLAAELLFKNCRELLLPVSKRLAESIHAYRGGYLPEQRREIERMLAQREILGVSSTNALELGIDIGSLEACIIIGYPGTVASLWQQAGRAGRGLEETVVFLIAQNTPIDQYLMTHSAYLFQQSPEEAVVDPDNPHICAGHIQCACHELPLRDDQAHTFGLFAEPVLELLEEEEVVRHIDQNWYWASSNYPAADVSLRNISGPVYTIQDSSQGERVIGTLDEISALSQLHDHAVYLHAAETYFVNKLDLEQKIAHVEKKDLDYYTQSVQSSQIQIDETLEETSWREGLVGFGEVTVTTSIPMFKKIRFHSRDSLGYEQLELPPQMLETMAFWWVPSEAAKEAVLGAGQVLGEALTGIANVLVEVAPLFVMCDTQDMGAVVDVRCLGEDALFLYDRYPGGIGYAKRCVGKIAEIMGTIHDVIRDCACRSGCPSCVGAAVPAFAMTDMDSAVRGRIPSKEAARFLMKTQLAD